MSRLLVGSATDVGLVRANNQDQLLVAPGLYAVADGMGGHAAGEVASATAIRALEAAFDASGQRTPESLEGAAKAANRAVWEQARTNRGMLGMGTTLVALAVVEQADGTNGLTIAHIGDSRVYLFRDDTLRQLTIDHSLVQELVDEGQITPAQATVHPQRHVLTRALGVEPSVAVDLIEMAPRHGDRFVLCSDGLPREASDSQIAAVLRRFGDPEEAAKELVYLANSGGGSDNVTVVVVDVLPNDNSPESRVEVRGPASPAQTGMPAPGDTTAAAPVEPAALGTAPGDGAGAREPFDGSDESPTAAVDGSTVLGEGAPRDRAPGRREGLQHRRAGPGRPAPSRVTWRVAAFVLALFVVVGGAVACLAWYSRAAYFVTISSGRITVFQGRPGGVLWFEPTVAERTIYTSSSVETSWLPVLRAGQVESSLAQAQLYINRLVSEEKEAQALVPPSAKGAPRHRAATGPTASVATTSAKSPAKAQQSPTTAPKVPTSAKQTAPKVKRPQ